MEEIQRPNIIITDIYKHIIFDASSRILIRDCNIENIIEEPTLYIFDCKHLIFCHCMFRDGNFPFTIINKEVDLLVFLLNTFISFDERYHIKFEGEEDTSNHEDNLNITIEDCKIKELVLKENVNINFTLQNCTIDKLFVVTKNMPLIMDELTTVKIFEEE